MKFNKLLTGILCSALVFQCSSVLGADEITQEDVNNMTPGWTLRDKQISDYKTTNSRGQFSLGTEIIEDDKEEDNEEENNETTFDQIINYSANSNIVSTEISTGYDNCYWAKIKGNRWMLIENGSPAFGWKIVRGKWYYMDNMGIMKTGWLNYKHQWYYLNEDGSMATNKWIGNYYVGYDGIMR